MPQTSSPYDNFADDRFGDFLATGVKYSVVMLTFAIGLETLWHYRVIGLKRAFAVICQDLFYRNHRDGLRFKEDTTKSGTSCAKCAKRTAKSFHSIFTQRG